MSQNVKHMLCTEKQAVRARRWNLFLLLCLSLALVVIANGTALDKRVSKRGQRQELPFEERIEAERRLSDLGYWTGAVDGTLDPASRYALIAFQKVEGRQRTGRLTKDELQALRTATRPIPQHTGYAHVEIDLGRQVLFIVDEGGSITRILPLCTGNEKPYVDHVEIMFQAPAARTHAHMTHTVAGVKRIGIVFLVADNLRTQDKQEVH